MCVGANWTNLSTSSGGVVALAFSPDGTMLASGAGFRGSDTNLTVWSVPGGNLLRTVPTAQTYHVGAITFSPDGQWVTTAGGDYAYGPTNTLNGTWQDLGAPLTNRTMDLVPRTSNAFYRVVSAPE